VADMTFLAKPERRTAAMLMVAGALLFAGWKAHDVIGAAYAAEYADVVRTVRKLDTNVARIMDRLGIKEEAELPPAPPIRTSGPHR
jgi:hypothetical protein